LATDSIAAASSNGYLEVFLNSALAEGEALGPLALLFLFLARFLPIIQLSPFLGAKILPNPVKLAFAIALFIIFLPKLLTVTSTPLGFNMYTALLLGKELFVGFIIGYLISIPFIIVQSAGIIIDHQRGGAALMVNDPTIQNQSSPLGTLFNYVLIFVFFAIDAPFLFIDVILTSYDVIPPDQFFNSAFFVKDTPFWKLQFSILGQVMALGIQLATPALLIMLMTDLFLGIANRLAPQVQITFLGMSLKSLLGLMLVTLGFSLIVDQFQKQSLHWIQVIKDVLVMIKTSGT
jgi:type III secretory pathway component EscT